MRHRMTGRGSSSSCALAVAGARRPALAWAAERGRPRRRRAHQPRQVADRPGHQLPDPPVHPPAPALQAAPREDGRAHAGHQDSRWTRRRRRGRRPRASRRRTPTRLRAAHAEAASIRAQALKEAAEEQSASWSRRRASRRAAGRGREGADGRRHPPGPRGAAARGRRPRHRRGREAHPEEPARRGPPAHRGRGHRAAQELIVKAYAPAPPVVRQGALRPGPGARSGRGDRAASSTRIAELIRRDAELHDLLRASVGDGRGQASRPPSRSRRGSSCPSSPAISSRWSPCRAGPISSPPSSRRTASLVDARRSAACGCACGRPCR